MQRFHLQHSQHLPPPTCSGPAPARQGRPRARQAISPSLVREATSTIVCRKSLYARSASSNTKRSSSSTTSGTMHSILACCASPVRSLYAARKRSYASTARGTRIIALHLGNAHEAIEPVELVYAAVAVVPSCRTKLSYQAGCWLSAAASTSWCHGRCHQCHQVEIRPTQMLPRLPLTRH